MITIRSLLGSGYAGGVNGSIFTGIIINRGVRPKDGDEFDDG